MKKIFHLMSITHNSYLNRLKQASMLAVSALLMLFHSASFSAPITSMHVFGDSLSDSGAFGVLFDGQFCRPPPYDNCRFSNGPVWVELVADELGVSADTAYSGGTNWAIGGARSDEILDFQVASYLASSGGVADQNGLYVLWGGANDNFQNNPDGTFDPNASAENILNSIIALAGAGATNFLVPNVPIADLWTSTFNAALSSGIAALDAGLNVIEFDALTLFTDVTLNPDAYGFINSTEPCFDGVSVCADPDLYSLWDTVHPTAAGHRIIASSVLDLIDVSAPGTALLLSIVFVALLRRSKK